MVTAYLLGYTVAMPLLGRLADVHGYVRIYWASLAVFGVGTTLVAVSGESEWLNGILEPLDQIVVARVIQAIGGGGAVPISLAIAAALTAPEHRGLALGIVAGAAEAGSMLGPAYGGAVIEIWGWRAIFWLNVPQAAAIAALLFWYRTGRDRRADGLPGRDDSDGRAGTGVAGFCPRGAVPSDVVGPFRIARGMCAVRWDARVGAAAAVEPILSGALFRVWAFVSANACQLLVGVALIIAMRRR